MKDMVIESRSYATEDLPDLGNRFFTGNGYLGVRGTLEEYGKAELAAVNLSGLYDQYGDGWREPLNAPNPFYFRLFSDGVPLSLPQAAPQSHLQALDILHALQTRQTCYPNGVCLTVERFAHMEHVHRLCLRASVSATMQTCIRLETGIDGDVWDIHGPHYAHMALNTQNGMLTAQAATNEGDTVAVCARPSFAHAHTRTDGTDGRKRVAMLSFTLAAGETATLELVAAIYTGKDAAAPMDAAMRDVQASPPYETLREQHIRAWAALWQRSRVVIDGDDRAMQAINYSLYHLLCIAPRHTQSLSVPARGLSGQTYKGAIFWDTEMFMLDFYLAVLPQAAKATLRYRIDTLPGALAKAKSYGFRGAFYAWESQEGGFDACSDYNVTDVFTGRPMRTYFRDKQIHITAAVVYGLWKYARWTGDPSLWREGGARVLIEAARFYHSLLVHRVESDTYELRDVIGPDEYHERVDNNAYTNEMARFVLEQAGAVLSVLKTDAPETYALLEKALHFEAELPAFSLAAQKLKRQTPDARGVIEQFDGYFDLENATVAQMRDRIKDPREYWGGAYGVASQTQVIKQADVITLLYMLRDSFDSATLSANYAYYLPRTEHGSSLSACMYALAACAIGKPDEAYPLFMKSAQADLVAGGKQWAGLVYIGGTHPAAAGGAYMALLWGFLGLRLEGDRLVLHPNLPTGWKGISLQVAHRGEQVLLACGTLAASGNREGNAPKPEALSC